MNKDRQFMNTKYRVKWNGQSYGLVKNPWDAYKETTINPKQTSPDLLPSIFNDSKQTAWRRG